MTQSDDFVRYLLDMSSGDGPPDPEQGDTEIFSPSPGGSSYPGMMPDQDAGYSPGAIDNRSGFQAKGKNSMEARTIDQSRKSPMSGSSSPYSSGGVGDNDPIVAYIRQAASKRGIDPEVALRVAAAEGGRHTVDPRTGFRVPDFSQPWQPAVEGSFNTGHSWWPYQLHYGGAGTPYAHYGDTAGMGNDFTDRTGYQPGDPAALEASIDFALDGARRSGWGAWYGAKAAGVNPWDGIPR